MHAAHNTLAKSNSFFDSRLTADKELAVFLAQ